MFTLRSLFALTFMIAIVCGLWTMGSRQQEEIGLQTPLFAVIVFLLATVAFFCILSWIGQGEQANERKSEKARVRFAFVNDTVAFVAISSLLVVLGRVVVRHLLP